MIKLASSGYKASGKRWYGVDPNAIVYPHVSSCVTVTCVTPAGLAGLHLAYVLSQEETRADLATFAPCAEGATSLYVIGVLGAWVPGGKNRTGLHYQGQGGGTLIERLREATGYGGVVQTCDTQAFSSEVRLRATLTRGVATFTWEVHAAPNPLPVTHFEHVAGNVMFTPRAPGNAGCAGCVIF